MFKSSTQLYLPVHKHTWESTVNIFCQKEADKHFTVKKEIMVKNSKVEKWQLPEMNLDVNDDGDIVSISFKFVKHHMTRGKL